MCCSPWCHRVRHDLATEQQQEAKLQYSAGAQYSLVAQTDDKESTCTAGDLCSIPGLGRSPGKGNAYPFQYSFPENSMDRGAWRAAVHGVAQSWTRLKRLSMYAQWNSSYVLQGNVPLCE